MPSMYQYRAHMVLLIVTLLPWLTTHASSGGDRIRANLQVQAADPGVAGLYTGPEGPEVSTGLADPIALRKASGARQQFVFGTVRSTLRQLGSSAVLSRTAATYEDGLRKEYASASGTTLVLYYTYTPSGLISTVRQAGDFGGNWFSTYAYNDSGRVVERIAEQEGAPSYRYTYTYSDFVTLQTALTERYQGGIWQPWDRWTYFGYEAGYPDSAIDEGWTGTSWAFNIRYDYDKSAMPGETIRLTSYWNGAAWQLVTRTRYVFDSNGRTTLQEQFRYSGSDWQIQNRATTTWDADGIVVQNLREIYASDGSLQTSTLEEFTKHPGAGITLITPQGWDAFNATDLTTIWWLAVGVTHVDISLSLDDGSSWTPIAALIPDTGVTGYDWTVPNTPSNHCRVRVSAAGDPSMFDLNSDPFIINAGLARFTHSTGAVQTDILPDGAIETFTYQGGPNALFSAGVLAGNITQGIKGVLASFNIQDFRSIQGLQSLGPQDYADQRTACTLGEITPSFGIEIDQTTASHAGDPFVFVMYRVRNPGAAALSEFYIGAFADWDVGNYAGNMGGIDVTRNLVYQYDQTQSSDLNYYGIVALSGLSGANVTDMSAQPVLLGLWISMIGPTETPQQGDQRSFLGSGPFTIDAGGEQTVGYAYVAGSTLSDLQTKAEAAQVVWNSGALTSVVEPPVPLSYSLEQNYPNPFNPSTTIRYSLPSQSQVTMNLYDALGRRVAVLVDQEQAAGHHEVRFDASGLASGAYLYRIRAGTFTQTRRLLILR